MEKQAALLLALCAMFLWGSWANTLLLFGTRFELYLFNYILGHFLAGFLTFHDALPSLNDTVSAGGFAMILLSALAGALFALGSLLAVASLDLAGGILGEKGAEIHGSSLMPWIHDILYTIHYIHIYIYTH